jgi:predicted lipoprotein with Yx(FWY)xxD motif
MTLRTGGLNMRRLALLLLPLTAAALIAAGCGSDESDGTSAAASKSEDAMKSDEAMKGGDAMKSDSKMTSDAMEAEAPMSARGARVRVVNSDFGGVIADGKGEAFYLFDKEDSKKPRCYGACAQVWPPALTKGKPVAGNGVKQSLLGTTKRRNGKLQVTYGGHPLYYYVDDSPGTILCHDVAEFGGLWLVVKPDGEAA